VGQTATIRRFTDLAGTQLVATTTYTYDTLHRLAQLQHQGGNGSAIAGYGFGYDAASRITRITDIDGTTNYGYDDTNQLVGADSSYRSDESYSYDANGNRTNAGYQTGVNNQLLSDGVYTYTYDDEGNLKTRTKIGTSEVRTFTWDYQNRLVSVTDQFGTMATSTVSYTYDVLNRRIAKSVNGSSTQFVYDGDNVILEFNGSAIPSVRYLQGPGVDQTLAQEGNGQTSWMLTDHLGTVRDLVNNSGSVVNHFTYDSLGQVLNSTPGGVDTRYKYTGREFDAETGLYYYRARYFDASVGRFIGQDPIGFSAGDSNLYRYVANSPIKYVDPLGLYGEVKSQKRTLEYVDSTGRHPAVNTLDVDFVRKYVDPAVYILTDVTVAHIKYSATQKGTGTESKNRNSIPDIQIDDVQGHIVGAQLGGSGTNFTNLFPQNRKANNRNPWKGFENDVRDLVESTKFVPAKCKCYIKYIVRLDYPQPQRNTSRRVTPGFPFALRPKTVTGLAQLWVGGIPIKQVGPVPAENPL